MYVYFYESIFKDKSIHMLSHLQTQKVIDDLYFQCLTKPYSKRQFFFKELREYEIIPLLRSIN
jgi:predicted adenine nucleotide alpha hydrolase (AANH) superfamily ATPase